MNNTHAAEYYKYTEIRRLAKLWVMGDRPVKHKYSVSLDITPPFKQNTCTAFIMGTTTPTGRRIISDLGWHNYLKGRYRTHYGFMPVSSVCLDVNI